MDPETTGAATARDNPLGRFLRARRERLSPESRMAVRCETRVSCAGPSGD
ncbi:hypothetical protein ABZ470_26100 [Streptosporangium sp. NPDC020072]